MMHLDLSKAAEAVPNHMSKPGQHGLAKTSIRQTHSQTTGISGSLAD